MVPSLHFSTKNDLKSFIFRRAGMLLVLGGLLASLASGCASDRYRYGFDSHFSLNVAPPPAWLTSAKAPLGPAEKEILSERGTPTFIHYVWKTDGSLIRSSDLSGHYGEADEMIKTIPKTWIYLDRDKGEEVIFSRGGASYKIRPLAETLMLICQHGDPSSRSDPFTVNGETHETWMWIESGLQVELAGDKVLNTKRFKGTGMGTDLMK